MENIKISQLDPASTLSGAEQVEVVQDGESRRTTAGAIAGLGGGGGGGAVSIFDPGRPGGTLDSQKNEYLTVAPGGEVDIANVAAGPGYISSLFAAFFGSDYAWRDAEIRIYYDGEAAPSVLMRHENFFFGQYAATNSAFSSEFFGHNRAAADTYGGYMNLPIPYTNGVRVTVKNVSATSFQLFSTTMIHRGVANTWPRTRKLLAKQFHVDAAAPDSVQTIIDEATGNGRLAAMWMLGDGLPGGASPRSAWLEGNICIYLNGDPTPSYESSGTEDYFLLSFYFGGAGANRNGGEVGTTFTNPTAGTYGAWRTHIRNPIEFNSGIRVTWQVGDTSQVPFTGTVRAWATVFYYVE